MIQPALAERALKWAHARRTRIRGYNPWAVAVHVTRHGAEDRVGGLAAEMAFWALLSVLPLLVTLAALLGYAERLVGAERLRAGQEALITAGSVVFSAELTGEVVRPFVTGMLQDGRGGTAITGLAVTLFLASRVFTATIRALDLAYRVEERRGLVRQRMIAVGMAGGFVLVLVVTLLLTVIGPLLGSGQMLANQIGVGGAFEIAWLFLRWPFLFAVMTLFLAAVYLWGPNVENRLRNCLPGAVLGVLLWTLASLLLRLYLEAGGGTTAFSLTDQAVALVARVLGTVVAGLLWTYVTGLAILLGGELNAELARTVRERRGVRRSRVSETMPIPRDGGAQGG